MLALNMSKEVLSAFGILNNKIAESNSVLDSRNDTSLEELTQKAEDQPAQYGDKKAKVEKIRKVSKEFCDYIDGIKKQVTSKTEKDAQGNFLYEQMDKGDLVDRLFFKGEKPSKEGKEFLDRIKNYPFQIRQIGGSSIADVEMKKIFARFATEPVKPAEKGAAPSPWFNYHYFGYPLIATVTKLTQLQADIKATESDVMTGMFQSSLVAAASLTAYKPIVVPEKSVFFQGEAVKGKIILGKFDPTLKAKSVIVNGSNVPAEAGQANFSFGAGNIGEHAITGSFNFDENGKIISLPINGNYVVVARPKSATISADKMNVVYRGVPNPMTISFAGISDDKVSASAPGLSKLGNGKYSMSPQSGTQVVINVTGILPDGKVSDSKVFRIKGIPSPIGTVRGEMGVVKGPKSSLEVSTVGAKLLDFDFEVGLDVLGFNFKVAGQPTVVVQGNRLNAQCKGVLSKAGRGDQVTISEIKTKLVGAGSYLLPRTAPVIYEIQ
jgi:gliding motility-associated protein GldM